MAEILLRLGSYGTLQPDSLEAMRNEYVVPLLHSAIYIVMEETNKELSMRPQYGIVEEESKGRVDYAIKGTNNISLRRWDCHFLLYSPEKISKASDTAYSIEFTKKALVNDSEEYANLCYVNAKTVTNGNDQSHVTSAESVSPQASYCRKWESASL
ncbi:hypothetical protein C1646_740040 [Rhizophagus diaphanus]|nr:hypothetical protein C1646_740040 [Rhizophagus diaphanus] [Rhizophagus sp. MUCL 43196]